MRTETIPFSEFMTGSYARKGKSFKHHAGGNKRNLTNILRASITVPFVWDMFKGSTAFAQEVVEVGAVPEATKQSILHAFDPLIELMVDLALPISGIMITGGALLIMIGNKEKGFTLIMNSALGFCLVNLSPMFLTLLESVGKAI